MTEQATFPAPTCTLSLQYVGEHHAVRAAELTAGCVTVWNTGALELVTKVERVSKCFVAVTTARLDWTRDGYVAAEPYAKPRRMKVDRAVGYSPKATQQYAQQRS